MATVTNIPASPRVCLANGLRIANFSSGHAFTFTDGTVLPACHPERVAALVLESVHAEYRFTNLRVDAPEVIEVRPRFEITQLCIDELRKLESDPLVDIVLVPRLVIEALQNVGRLRNYTKVATILVADRVAKTAHTNKFCR